MSGILWYTAHIVTYGILWYTADIVTVKRINDKLRGGENQVKLVEVAQGRFFCNGVNAKTFYRNCLEDALYPF